MSTTTTPNMGLVLPVPSSEPGPTWAIELVTAYGLLDSHDHSAGKGVQVTPAGLNINADLSFYNAGAPVNATGLRMARFTSQTSDLAGVGDISGLYVKSGDLWYNNAGGSHVQVTSGTTLATSVLPPANWTTSSTNTDVTIAAGATYTMLLVDSSTGTRNITLPAANAVASGRYFVVKASTTSANLIAVLPAGTDTIDGYPAVAINPLTGYVGNRRGAVIFVSDGVSQWRMVRDVDSQQVATASMPGLIELGGDLQGTGGTAAAPRVSGITGLGSPLTAAIHARNITIDDPTGGSTVLWNVSQRGTAGSAGLFQIVGQSASLGAGGDVQFVGGSASGTLANGGNVWLVSGSPDIGGSGSGGNIILQTQNPVGAGYIAGSLSVIQGSILPLSCATVATTTRRAVTIGGTSISTLSSTELPTGDGVVILRAAGTAPSAASGSGLGITTLWSSGGSAGGLGIMSDQVGAHRLVVTSTISIGATAGGTAIPTAAGFLVITIDGTVYKIPYCAN